jgi:hypothetical protein
MVGRTHQCLSDDSAFGGTSLPLIFAGRAVVQSERVSGIMPL